MKKYLGKRFMAVVTASLLMLSAVPASAVTDESSESTATTVKAAEQTTASTVNTADTTETAADKVTSESNTEAAENKEETTDKVTEETTNKVSENEQEQVSNNENKLPELEANAESDFVVDSNGVLTEYKGAGGDIVIPDTVKMILYNAFPGNIEDSITSVTIPDSLVYFGHSAGDKDLDFFDIFGGMQNLKSFFVYSNSTKYSSIDGVLYSKDKDQTTLVIYPSGKENKSFNVPSSVTKIKEDAFYGCSNLTSITIPNSVTSIGEHAFHGCTNLTNITIPDSVTELGGDFLFRDCWSLESVSLPKTTKGWYSIYEGGSWIPGMDTKWEGTFTGCKSLKSVKLPEGVTGISNYSGDYLSELFNGCNSLESIELPSSLNGIDLRTFEELPSIKKIVFNGNAPKITFLGKVFNGLLSFEGTPNATIYYKSTATGYTTPEWMGRPCYPISNNDGNANDGNTNGGNVNDGNNGSQSMPSGNQPIISTLSEQDQKIAKDKVLAALGVASLDKNSQMHFYDIALKNMATGEIYTKENFPKDGVDVVIPYPDGMNKHNFTFRLFHFANGVNGTPEEITPLTLTDDGIMFHVGSMSPFVLVSTKTDGVTSPKTGDNSMLVWWIAPMLIAGAGCAVIIKKKARKA